jgi:hypothetical protein
MPFTISHAAAALPLRRLGRGRLPLTAMMIGAMTPDFAYFASMGPERVATHTLGGIFWFCLPVGLLAWFTYMRFFEQPTVALLPRPWRGHFTREREPMSLRLLALAAVAVIVGAVTHLAWDSFTHGDTMIATAFPVLHTELFRIGEVHVRLYWFLQLLSSLLGGVALVVWIIRAPWSNGAAPVHVEDSPIPDFARLGAVFVLVVVSSSVALGSYFDHSYLIIESRLFFLAIAGMKAFGITWAAIVFFVDRYLRRIHGSNATVSPAY